MLRVLRATAGAVGNVSLRVIGVIRRTGLHKWVATSYSCQVLVKWLEGRFHLLQGEAVRTVSPPHPDWRPGDPQPIPYEGRHAALDPAALGASACYPLVISTVVPRPIALVSTLSLSGELNLAPFSYFGAMGHDPPLIAISVCRSGDRGGGMKDTCQNIVETGEFVVNIMSSWFVEAANHTCGNFARGVNEFALSGLTELGSRKVKAPRVAESAVHMECRLVHQYDAKNAAGRDTTTIFIGEIVMFHVHDGVAARSPSGKVVVDPKKLKAISRLGGNTYGETTRIFDLPRPDRNV